MRRLTGSFVLAALLAGCGGEDAPTTAPTARATPVASAAMPEPDLAVCPKAEPVDYRIRTRPVPIPPAFDGLARSDMDHLAFLTTSGGTVCVDSTWIESIESADVSGDGRFVSFDWLGYEAFGHVVVDRSGRGQVIDTGNPPFASPSGRRLASVDLGEAGFGSLNAFAVWDIRPTGLRQAAEVSDGFPSGDWRIDRWRGEICVELSVVPLERQPEDYRDMPSTPRDHWFAAEANGWKPVPGACPPA